MSFNKKIAEKILLDLQKAKNLNLSFEALENNILRNLAAVDSTFPSHIKNMIEEILSKIAQHQQEQYSATLNTPQEGTYDETLPVGNLFESEIGYLLEYTN